MTAVSALAPRLVGPAVVALGLGVGAAAAVQPKLAVLGAVAAVAAGIGIRWPSVMVVAVFGGILFDRLGVTGSKLGDFPVTASKLATLATIGAWAVHAPLTGARIVRWHAIQNAMLGVIAATAVTIAIANSMSNGKFTLYGLVMMTVLVSVVYAILAEVELAPLYRWMAAILVAALLNAVLRPGAPGADGRVSGTMGDPNEWATTILLLAPMLLGGLADDPTATGRLLRIALAGLAPLGVLRSESRAALVAGTLLLPGVLWLLRGRRSELLVVGGLGALAAPFVLDLQTALERFVRLLQTVGGETTAVRDDSFEERSELFRQGVQLFRDNWAVGAGPGNFASATGFVSHEWTLRPAHNTYLEIASEQGLLGLLPTAIFLGTVAWTVRRTFQRATTDRDRHRVLGAGLGLGALAAMAATLGLLTFAMGYLTLGIALATLHQADRRAEGDHAAG